MTGVSESSSSSSLCLQSSETLLQKVVPRETPPVSNCTRKNAPGEFPFHLVLVKCYLVQSCEENLAKMFSSVQLLSRVQLFATSWTAAHQASLSITNSQSLLKLTSIASVMSSNHLILCRPLLPPSSFPSIRVFSSESILHISWPKYWCFSFSISPSIEYSGLIWEAQYLWGKEFLTDFFSPLEYILRKCGQSTVPGCNLKSFFSLCSVW